jgi:hypothetical protein
MTERLLTFRNMDDNDMEKTRTFAPESGPPVQDAWLDRLSYRRLLSVAGSMLIAIKAPNAVFRKVYNAARMIPHNMRRTETAKMARQALVTEMKGYLNVHRSLDPLRVEHIERPHEQRFPELSEWGTLPPGFWHVSLEEFAGRLAFNRHRKAQLQLLYEALILLKSAGCKKVTIAGSFTSNKPKPGDIDLIWDTDGLDSEQLGPMFDEDNSIERQKLFGIDASCEEWKLKLSIVQSLWGGDAPTRKEFIDNEFDQLPRFRAVGVLVLDLTQDLAALRF